MRNFACLAPALAVAACAAAPVASDRSVGSTAPAAASDGTCDAAGTENFIGQRRSNETGTAIVAATGAIQLRWVTPGMMVTMEFLPTRVTVHVDERGLITRIVCG